MQATLKTENEKEVVFRFDHLYGWIVLVAGPGLLLLWPRLEADARIWVAGFALIMAVFGVLTVLRRFELRLDLASGTWHRRQGFWPRVAADSGPLSDVRVVKMCFRLGTKDKGGVAIGCDVELEVTGEAWPKPLRYARTQNLPAAEHLARRVADRLGIPVEEHTP